MQKQINIKYIRHRSAKSIVMSWFRNEHPRLSEKKLLKIKTPFELLLNKNKIKQGTVEQLIKTVLALNIWAYCKHVDEYTKEIHFWYGKKCTDEKIVGTMAHELYHAIGFSSENLACRIGAICEYSYILCKKMIERRKKCKYQK